MITVVEDQSKVVAPNEARIFLESQDSVELEGKMAQEKAKEYAQSLGIIPAMLSAWYGPFPVLADGTPLESAEDMQQWRKESLMNGGRMKYRNEFKIVSPHPRRAI